MHLVTPAPARHRPTRWLAALAALALLLPGVALPVTPIAPPAVGVAAAATPDLTMVSDARYAVQPDKHRVHVVVDVTATNHRPDTAAATYYFDQGYLAVLPGTTGFRVATLGASATAPKPSVRVTATAPGYTLLSLAFGRHLLSGQTIRLRLQFDLPDPGTPPTRQIRIGTTLVAFPVWAFATNDTAGSTVSVTFPSGYEVTVLAGSMPAPTVAADGTVVLRAGPLATPLTFYAFLSAERSSSLVSSTVATKVGGTPVSIVLRAWPDDPAWATRTGSDFVRGLPRLSAAIGLPYPGGDLTVEETSSRATGGYAGLFDASTATVQVAYDARDDVALHEAAHVWFNGRLLAERWANEAFASAYAAQVATALGIAATAPKLTTRLLAARIPLNAWSAVGEEPATVEDYGYAASSRLAAEIVARAGVAALRDVWAAAAARRAAYQPTGTLGPADLLPAAMGAPDWRTILDLLEQRTGVSFTDLWREWVVRPNEAPLLGDRTAARAAYVDAVSRAGSWQLSPLIRRAMDAWQFGDARRLIGQANAAVEEWARVTAAAAAIGLAPADAARRAFEGGAGPVAASQEMDAELDAIAVIRDTAAAGAGDRSAFESIGLVGEAPEADLAAARSAYEAGDTAAAVADATTARAIWAGAEEAGRRRALLALFLVVAFGGLGAIAIGRLRSARRGRVAATAAATATATPTPSLAAHAVTPGASSRPSDAPGPYATLAGEAPDAAPPPSDRATDERWETPR